MNSVSATHNPVHSASSTSTKKGGRKSTSLPTSTVEYLKAWMMSDEHIAHPYPTEQEKQEIMIETGIGAKQLTNWFVNNRKRYWRPRVGGAEKNDAASSSSSPPSSSNESRRSKRTPKLTSSFSLLNAYVYDQQEDPHTISAPTSEDDESIGASSLKSAGSSLTNKKLTIISPSKLAVAHQLAMASLALSNDDGFQRHEEVNVHIFRPEGSTSNALPTIRDLTIRSSVPEGRVILATFKCSISYTVPFEIKHDKKKIQSRRDGEVLKVKKHYLKLYLATRGIHSASTPVGKDANSHNEDIIPSVSTDSLVSAIAAETTLPAIVSSMNCQASSHAVVSPFKASSNSSFTATTSSQLPYKKRSRLMTCVNLDQQEDNISPTSCPVVSQKRARIAGDEDQWKELCQNAMSLYCESLPSLEDAAMMFGYSQ